MSRRLGLAISFLAAIIVVMLILADGDSLRRGPRGPADAPGDLALGERREEPRLAFGLWSSSPTTLSADVLADLSKGLAAAGRENFAIEIEADPRAFLRDARSRKVEQALAGALGAGHFGRVTFTKPAAHGAFDWLFDLDPRRRAVGLAISRIATTPVDPPDWSRFAGAPAANAIFGFFAPGAERSFAISDPRMTQSQAGTIDFWFSPEWHELLGYDPAILSLGDSVGPRFEVHILDKRDGIAIWDGTKDGYTALPYDFTGAKAYHVSLVTNGKETSIAIDGRRLDRSIPLGYGAIAADTLVVGAGVGGADRFIGRAGRFRFWADVLLYDQWTKLSGLPEEIDFADPLRAKLVAVTQYAPGSGGIDLITKPAVAAPREGWWSPVGAADIRIHNLPEFEAGREPPQFSSLQAELGAAATNISSSGDEALQQDEDVFSPHFAVHENYKLVTDEGVDPAQFQLPSELRGQTTEAATWSDGSLHSLTISHDDNGVTSISPRYCPTANSAAPPANCPPTPQTPDDFTFDADEYIRGVTWTRTTTGHLRNFRIATNKRVSDVYGASAGAAEPVLRDYAIWMPPGVRPLGVSTHYNVTGGKRAVGFELIPPPEIARPGVTLMSDSGESSRFVRVDETHFASVNPYPALLTRPNVGAPATPVLRVLDPLRIAVDGIPDEIAFVPRRDAAQPKTGFNDTFVALSKAVNLQSNYVGYDILTMDPLHLANTGTDKRIFAMPSGDSADYYDANRIFVPNGLFYVPEFTGTNHGVVRSADTYSQYRDAFSDTVSAGLAGKLLPVSFSLSARMSSARESMSEDKVSKSLGLAKAVFYDLVLDKAHMALDPDFVAEVLAIQRNGRYDEFVRMFGTHYASAVVYGGLGVLEIDVTETMRETLLEKGVGIKMETSFLLDADTQTSVSFGMDHEEDHQKTFKQTIGSQTENFYWIGGAHGGGDKSSWSVGTDGVAPVHVSLRRVEELLSPVYFDDPDIYNRVRLELKKWIDQRLADAAAFVPNENATPQYMLEVRLDKVFCSTDSDGSPLQPGQNIVNGKLTQTRVPRTQFPIVTLNLRNASELFYRNYEDATDPADTTYTPFTVTCPSYTDLIPQSPYLQTHGLARFRLSADELANFDTRVEIDDRRDLEHFVIYPPKPPPDQSTINLQAFIAGLTAGLSIAVEEAFTPDGSPLINHDNSPPVPGLRGASFPVTNFFCEPKQGVCLPISVTADRLDSLLGRWFQSSVVFPDDSTCAYCAERQARFSVRVVR